MNITRKNSPKNLHIFNKYLNNNYKILPFKVKNLEVGDIKYYPPVSNE